MKPGRELDALVAEKVMGWTEIEEVKQTHLAMPQLLGIKACEIASPYTGYRPKHFIPEYSTGIKEAFEVIEALKSGFSIDVNFDQSNISTLGVTAKVTLCSKADGEKYIAEAQDSEERITSRKVVAHAICLAALKALNVE